MILTSLVDLDLLLAEDLVFDSLTATVTFLKTHSDYNLLPLACVLSYRQ